jgi:magnesium chelatase subunit D
MSPFDPSWDRSSAPQAASFSDAILAAALLAIDPTLTGIWLRAWSGEARERYLKNLLALFPAGTQAKKLPLSITDDRLLGGLDLPATLAAGRPVHTAGLLREAKSHLLHIAMAERLSPQHAGKILAQLDHGAGLTLIALDEGILDEAPPKTLTERLAFTVDALPGMAEPWPDPLVIQIARKNLAAVHTAAHAIDHICALSIALGVHSARAEIFALRAARASAALAGRDAVEPADIEIAARLVLLPRATRLPSAPEAPESQDSPPEPEPDPGEDHRPDQKLDDSVADAKTTPLPPALLAALAAATAPSRKARGGGTPGKSAAPTRGRPAGARPGPLTGAAKLAILETLRAAAPWQPLRARVENQKIAIRQDDFRIKKFRQNPRAIAIFAVDASGSSALNRLSEAKGAIQHLLADCYIRRDQVALIAFRGMSAEMLLPPTHALARAKKTLSSLPGGGPTPLATGIDALRALADAERRAGKLPLLVVLTDGGANVSRDGAQSRPAAAADAMAAARACRAQRFSALVVDTSPRPQKFVRELAAEMGAKYLPLPYADPKLLSRAVQAEGARRDSQH